MDEDEAVIAQEGHKNQDHETPASNVDMSDTETVSILDGDKEANTSTWTTAPKSRAKPYTITRSGRKCFTPKHLQDDLAPCDLAKKSCRSQSICSISVRL